MEMIFSWLEVVELEVNRFFRGRVVVQLKFPNDDRDDPDYLEFEVFRFGTDPIGITIRRAHGFRFRNLWLRKGERTERGHYPLFVVKKAMESLNGPVLGDIDPEYREEFIQLVLYLRQLARAEAASNRGDAREESRDPQLHATTGLGEAMMDAGLKPATVTSNSKERAPKARPGGKKGRKAAREAGARAVAGTPAAQEMLDADAGLLEATG